MTIDPIWFEWSENAVEEAAESHRLVINQIIYAEISIRFSSIEELEEALPSALVQREQIPFEAAFLAGKCFADYRRRGGSKASALPDFFIGAHAAVSGYRLITRDVSRFKTYFPKLDVVSPS